MDAHVERDENRVHKERDVHVVPLFGREHDSSPQCWCVPRLRWDYTPQDGGRVWVHRVEN